MSASGPDAASPFHAGEHAVQERVGVREMIAPWARQVVRPFMPDQHRDFYAQLPFIVVAARDADARPWASLLTGEPGFIAVPDPVTLYIGSRPVPGDALEHTLGAGSDIGVLGIELDTRRRNRVNGTVTETDSSGLLFRSAQSFGNCPQYITGREWRSVRVDPELIRRTTSTRLDDAMQNLVRDADTLFIASGYRSEGEDAAYGMDASHRGGPTGFVEVLDERHLLFPDYAGNNHFNTLGNIELDPRVGVTFVDFEKGSLLQITGSAVIDWDSPEVAKRPGAKRLITVAIDAVVRLENILPIRWGQPHASIRSLRLIEKHPESIDVTSFLFASRDGGDLPGFDAGQHLPIEVPIDGVVHKRTYSLSNGPRQGRYRISVKREARGTVSRYLHDSLKAGDIVSSQTPQGDFVSSDGDCPVVLIGGGIGITPLISMLHALSGTDRQVCFVHGVRDGEHHPFADEVRRIAAANENVSTLFAYSRPGAADRRGRDYDHPARLTADLIADAIPAKDAEYYLCGPAQFLADLTYGLGELGVDAARIHTETF